MGVYSPGDYVIYIAILLIILRFLPRYLFSRVKFDIDFIKAVSPYLLLGIFLRLLVDVGLFERDKLWNITPGVYILMILLVLVFIGVGFYVSRSLGVPYWYVPFGAGVLMLLPVSYILSSHISNPDRILYPLILTSVILFMVYLASKYFRVGIFQRRDNLAIIFSHLLDGCATFVAYTYYGFYEEHLLPIYLISLAGNNAFIMMPLKLSLILLVLYLLEKWHVEDREVDETLYRVIKFTLFILGIGPGLRDTLLPSLVQ